MTVQSDPELRGPSDNELRGPSDKEVVAHLQRLATARAHLLHAEQSAAQLEEQNRSARVRNTEIEVAHTALLWAQAELLSTNRVAKAQKAVDAARADEKRVLRRAGYTSFSHYLSDRSTTPTSDIALELAAKEHAAAVAEWEALAPCDDGRLDAASADRGHHPTEAVLVIDESAATVVIDLTGESPRRIA